MNTDGHRHIPALRLLERLAVTTALAAFGWLVVLHIAMVLTEAPMEMRDGAMLVTTRALLAGRNPFALANLVESGNAYGIVYNLAVVPFALVLGGGFVAHRLVAALGIFGAAAIVYRWLRLGGVGRGDALLGTGVVYAGLVYFTGGVARPDGLGVFLMLAAVEAMRRRDLDVRGYAVGLALSEAALLTKLYFVWPAFAAAAYVFCCRDVRRGLVYGAATIGATVATLLLAGTVLPGYAAYVLVANLDDLDYSLSYLLRQLGEWSLFDLPILAVGVVAGIHALWWAYPLAPRSGERVARAKRATGEGLVRTEAKLPLTPAPLPVSGEREETVLRHHFLSAMAALGAIAIAGSLGGHTGAHLSYFFQLLSPFLAVAVLVPALRLGWARAVFRLTLPLAIFLNAHWFPLDLGRIREAGITFAQLRQLIAANAPALGTPEFSGALALDGERVSETGHSSYLANATRGEAPIFLRPIMPPLSELRAAWNEATEESRTAIDFKRYGLALTGPSPSAFIPIDLLRANYRIERSIVIDMPWALQTWPVRIWRPRP